MPGFRGSKAKSGIFPSVGLSANQYSILIHQAIRARWQISQSKKSNLCADARLTVSIKKAKRQKYAVYSREHNAPKGR